MSVDENAIVTAFVTALQTKFGASARISPFEGVIGNDVLDQVKVFPTILVLVQEIEFSSKDEVGELIQGAPVIVTLLIATQSFTNKTERQTGAYEVLKACRKVLHNKSLGISTANFRVLDQKLAEVSASKSLYRQRYAGEIIFSED